jgi:branched-chain amino acid transport system ATP-binding protein
LAVRGASKNFGSLEAVSDVTLTLPEKKVTALIGPNGAGKTTLFNMISGEIPPTRGTVLLNGEAITGMPSHAVAALGLRRTFQTVRLFPEMTVHENVMVGLHLAVARDWLSAALALRTVRKIEREGARLAMEALDYFGIRQTAKLLTRQLPYGQQRLVEMARAWVSSPRVLLLDEPAAGLNEHETEMLGSILQRIRSDGCTLLLIEHDMHLVMGIADRVLVLNYGQLIADGPPHEIQRNEAVLEAYLGTRRPAGMSFRDA